MSHTPETRLRAYQKVKQRRSDWLAANGPCRNCGSPDRLEVDHVNPSSKVSHRIWTWSDARREIELAKCQVLCYECHAMKTIQFLRSTEHGSIGMYEQGCRCDLCKKYQRDRVYAWRLKKWGTTSSKASRRQSYGVRTGGISRGSDLPGEGSVSAGVVAASRFTRQPLRW